jgi:group I intron endonuclease
MIVYLVTNKVNGKRYVGQTTGLLHKRWKQHGKPSNNRNTYFVNAIQKYGREKFKVEVLRVCHSKPEMDRVEKFYILKLSTLRPGGYNLTTGGEGTPGHTVSKAGRLRMKNAHLGKKHSEEHKINISKALKLAYKEDRHKKVMHLVGNKLGCGRIPKTAFKRGYTPWNKGLKYKLGKYKLRKK